MPDFDEPAIREVTVSHFLFCEPRRRMIWVIDPGKPVVVGPGRIVDPRVGLGHLMKRKIRARRQGRIVSVDFSNLKDPGWGPPVAFLFAQSAFILAGQSSAPGEPIFSEQNRHRLAGWVPGAPRRAFESLQGAAHRIPIGRQPNN